MITSVSTAGGQLVANGLIGVTAFQAPITLTPGAAPRGNDACPILDLALGPINLSLLGLNVDTSAICLEITALPGGGLLGDLLCAITNLLSGGLSIGDVLALLSPTQLAVLDAGLTQTLNQAVFIPLTRSDAVSAASCEILTLQLGPLDLNLLGLRVELDDCDGGPVVLEVTATPGGGLLGDLLCGLSNLLRGNSSRIPIVLQSIAQLLGALLS